MGLTFDRSFLEMAEKHPFWTPIPGILTGVASYTTSWDTIHTLRRLTAYSLHLHSAERC
jgi:hypothetical protein